MDIILNIIPLLFVDFAWKSVFTFFLNMKISLFLELVDPDFLLTEPVIFKVYFTKSSFNLTLHTLPHLQHENYTLKFSQMPFEVSTTA